MKQKSAEISPGACGENFFKTGGSTTPLWLDLVADKRVFFRRQGIYRLDEVVSMLLKKP